MVPVSEYYRTLKLIIRNFFGFSLREANGFIVLILLMAIMFVIPTFLANWLKSNKKIEVEKSVVEAIKPTEEILVEPFETPNR
jgi:uncharacterized protein YqhQ